jgi:hypothetical protein
MLNFKFAHKVVSSLKKICVLHVKGVLSSVLCHNMFLKILFNLKYIFYNFFIFDINILKLSKK